MHDDVPTAPQMESRPVNLPHLHTLTPPETTRLHAAGAQLHTASRTVQGWGGWELRRGSKDPLTPSSFLERTSVDLILSVSGGQSQLL